MRVFLFISILISWAATAQHTPLLGHYTMNPVVLNPSFTGIDGIPVASALYRAQWVGIKGAPETQVISWSTLLKDNKNGIGGVLYRDAIGVSSRVGINASYAHQYKVNSELKLSLGLSGGISIYRSDWNKIETTDLNDGAFNVAGQSLVAPDVSFGSLLYNERYFISFSLPFFIQHQEVGQEMVSNVDLSSTNYLFGGGYQFELSRDLKLRTSALLKFNPSSKTQVDITPSLTYKDMFTAGMSYRSQDAVIMLLGYNASDQLYVGYNYDITLSDINLYSNGSHELFVRYKFRYSLNVESPRFF